MVVEEARRARGGGSTPRVQQGFRLRSTTTSKEQAQRQVQKTKEAKAKAIRQERRRIEGVHPATTPRQGVLTRRGSAPRVHMNAAGSQVSVGSALPKARSPRCAGGASFGTARRGSQRSDVSSNGKGHRYTEDDLASSPVSPHTDPMPPHAPPASVPLLAVHSLPAAAVEDSPATTVAETPGTEPQSSRAAHDSPPPMSLAGPCTDGASAASSAATTPAPPPCGGAGAVQSPCAVPDEGPASPTSPKVPFQRTRGKLSTSPQRQVAPSAWHAGGPALQRSHSASQREGGSRTFHAPGGGAQRRGGGAGDRAFSPSRPGGAHPAAHAKLKEAGSVLTRSRSMDTHPRYRGGGSSTFTVVSPRVHFGRGTPRQPGRTPRGAKATLQKQESQTFGPVVAVKRVARGASPQGVASMHPLEQSFTKLAASRGMPALEPQEEPHKRVPKAAGDRSPRATSRSATPPKRKAPARPHPTEPPPAAAQDAVQPMFAPLSAAAAPSARGQLPAPLLLSYTHMVPRNPGSLPAASCTSAMDTARKRVRFTQSGAAPPHTTSHSPPESEGGLSPTSSSTKTMTPRDGRPMGHVCVT